MSLSPSTTSLDALPCGFLQLDGGDRVVEWNQRLERWTGHARAAVVGRRLAEIFPGNPALDTLLTEVRANRQPRVLAQMFHHRFIPVPLPPGHISGLAEMQQEAHLVPLDTPAGHLAISILDVTPLVVGQQRSQALIEERNRTEEAVRRRAEFLEALNQTTLEMMGRRNVTELLRALAERAGILLHSPHVEIDLLEGEELVVRAFSPGCEYLRGDRVRRGEAPLGWRAVDTREPVVVSSYANHPDARTIYEPYRLQAVAEIPIVRGSECVGVLGLARTQRGMPYTDEEIRQGALLARMAALVLHNAKIHEEAVAEAEARTVALRESEEKFRRLFFQSPIIVSLLSVPEGRIVEMNGAALATYGYTREEVLGRTSVELNLWVDLSLRQRYLTELRARGSVNAFEAQMRRKNGEIFTVLYSGSLIMIAGAPYSLVSLQDITARKQSEAARDHSLALMRATLESTADGLLVVNGTGHIETYNRNFAEMWRLDAVDLNDQAGEERMLRKILDQLVTPESFLVSVRDVYLRSEDEVFDELHCKDGRVFERYSHPQILSGTPTGRVWSFRDITDRRRADAALRESEERFRVLAEVSPVGIFSTDPEGRTVFVNRRWCELSGLGPDEALGDGWRRALHPEDRERVAANWDIAVRDGTSSVAEFRFVRPDGSVAWLVGQSRAQRRPDGTLAGYVGTITDVTDLKRIEAERAKIDSQLRQSRKMESLGTLAGGIAHDFNNILNGTFGFVDLARLELESGHPAHAWLDRIAASSQRARELVRQILTFGRKHEGERVPQQLHPVVDEALRLLRSTLPAMVELEIRLAQDTPPVRADASQIHQVVLNLCTNAWHALPPRGGRITVQLESCSLTSAQAAIHPDLSAGIWVRLAVTDEGCGMDQATLDHIFEPFFTTRQTGSGTGLGLSVVHGIVKSHEGAIVVRSNVGQGSSFEVYFPISALGAVTPPVAPARAPRGNGEHIMVVDDDGVSGFAIEKMIETLGYVVCRHARPEEALARVTQAPAEFDLVVTDLAMPGMDGEELLERLLKIRPTLPIVVVSGFVAPERQHLLETKGARAVLRKPVSRDEIGSAVAEHLRKNH